MPIATVTDREKTALREAARRVAEIAALPVQQERRKLWTDHNRLAKTRPILCVFPEGSWRELLPRDGMVCKQPLLQNWEWDLKSRIYHHEHLFDDKVLTANVNVWPAITDTGWGLEPKRKESTEAFGAFQIDPVILERSDLKKLRVPSFIHNERETQQRLALAHELFDGILNVRLRSGGPTFHLMSQFCRLRGLDNVMMDLAAEPEFVHEAMAILEAGNRALSDQIEAMGLLTLNNEEDYTGSGGMAFSDELPAPGFDGKRVRRIDCWGSAESQEMALVSPEMHEEFVLQYEKRLLAPYGLNAYGCCEDLTAKMSYVFQIPRIRRISISPFANVEKCAELLGDKYVYSWKPHPAHLVGSFNEAKIRSYLEHAVKATRGCRVEMILKDTHTCENHPERFTRWTQIAREAVERWA